MARRILSSFFLLAVIGSWSAGAAQTLPTAGEAMGSTDASSPAKAVTELDFEGDRVTGEPVKPLGENLRGEKHVRTDSLIRVRQNFVPEMIRSVEDL